VSIFGNPLMKSLGIGPSKPTLLFKLKYFSFGRLRYGITPVRSVWLMLNTTSDFRAFISGMRDPEMDVNERFKNLRFVKLEMQSGSRPSNPVFWLRSRLTKAVALQRTAGMVLEILVLAIDRKVRAVRKPRLVGIVPVQ
jgi:hypothetical protein